MAVREPWSWLLKSGIITKDELVQRVIIDIQLDDVVRVYKQVLGQEKWFELSMPPELDVEIVKAP